MRGVGYIVPPIAVQKFEREKIIEALKDAAVETLGLPGDTVVASIRFCCTSQSWLVIYTHDSFPDVEAVVYQPVSI